MQPERLEGPQDLVGGAWAFAGRIDVFDANQPAPPVRARVQKAADGRDQGAEMERAAGRGREASYVTALTRTSCDLSRDAGRAESDLSRDRGRGWGISDTSRPGRRTASHAARGVPGPRRSRSRQAALRGA